MSPANRVEACPEPNKKRRTGDKCKQMGIDAMKSSFDASGYRIGRTDGPLRCLWHPGVDPSAGKEFHPNIGKPRVDNSKGIHNNLLGMIGNTPMVRIQKIAQEEGVECDLLAKCEFMSVGGSVKDRIALRMIEEAEMEGRIKPGDTLIEPTSGNTGIGIAMIASVKGYRSIMTLPEKMSNEKVLTA